VGYWCAAQLESGHINYALHCLKQSYEVYAPRLRTVRVSHGRKIESRPLLFPSYIFVAITALGQWWDARWAPGVIRLIMAGDATPARVPDGIITQLRSHERDGAIELLAKPPRGFRRGDPVKILHGPFVGLAGLYQGMKPRERVEILLRLLGSEQRVILAKQDIEAIS
jgi:transcriptional antiterminator RfaH